MKTILTKALKYTATGATIGLCAGIAIGIMVAVMAGFLGFLAAFGGVHQDDPNVGDIILLVAAIGAGCGFIYGLFSGIGDVRNENSKRTNPNKEACYAITFSASADTLLELIKLVTDARLVASGAVIVNSDVSVKYQTYTYHAVIEQGTAKRFPDSTEVVDIPGQSTKIVTRKSINEGGASLLSEDCGALVSQFLPPGPSYTSADALHGGSFSTTMEMRIDAHQAEQLRTQLPAKFATVS
jgi:hypothetical protein